MDWRASTWDRLPPCSIISAALAAAKRLSGLVAAHAARQSLAWAAAHPTWSLMCLDA